MNLLVLALVMVNLVPATLSHEADAPEPCTRLGRLCVQTATCDTETRQCVCQEGTSGHGQFQCVNNATQRLCTVTADPHVTTWDDAHAAVNLPCWYRVTRMRIIVDASLALVLEVDVLARNTLTDNGLFYVDEVKIVNTLLRLGVEEDMITFDIDGDQIRNAAGGNPWLYNDMTWNRIDFSFRWDPVDMMAIFVPFRDDIMVIFRAFVLDQLPQVRKPGVGVTVPDSEVFIVSFDDFDQVCLVPGMGPDALRDAARDWDLQPPSLLLLHYLLLQTDLGQYDENQCNRTREFLEECDNVPKLAVKLCGFILNNKSTRQCLQDVGEDPMRVFKWCTRWSCAENTNRCQMAQDAVLTNGCFSTDLFQDIGCNATLLLAENDRLVALES